SHNMLLPSRSLPNDSVAKLRLQSGNRKLRKTVKTATRENTRKSDWSRTAAKAPARTSGPAGDQGVNVRSAGNVSAQSRYVARLLHSCHGSPGARQRQWFMP